MIMYKPDNTIQANQYHRPKRLGRPETLKIKASKRSRMASSFRIGLFALFVVVTSAGLRAQQQGQQTGSETEETLREQRAYLLNLMSFSSDATEARLALQSLAQLVEDGQLSRDDSLLIEALTRLAQRGTALKIYDGKGNVLNNDYVVRSDACNFLGKLGGDRAVGGLIAVMQSDIEPVVVAVAMESLVKALPEGSPTLIRMLTEVFYSYHTSHQDNTLARSFLYAAAEYGANSNGKLLSPYLLQAVHDMSTPNSAYITSLRIKARSLILSWLRAEYPNWEDLQ